jgi:hypothetical protein
LSHGCLLVRCLRSLPPDGAALLLVLSRLKICEPNGSFFLFFQRWKVATTTHNNEQATTRVEPVFVRPAVIFMTVLRGGTEFKFMLARTTEGPRTGREYGCVYFNLLNSK